MTTDRSAASRFTELLLENLGRHLTDPGFVRSRIAAIREHAPGFPETLFCKGCVLPILDRVVTQFLDAEFGCAPTQIRNALRCEGFSTLPKIYTPGVNQSGFSGFTWGTNYQAISKTGKSLSAGSKGFLPCPDFGVVLTSPKFTILGETKFSEAQAEISTRDLVNDLKYYMGLPSEPDKGWDYDFGIGIAYAAGGDSPRRSELIMDYFATHRFILARFRG